MNKEIFFGYRLAKDVFNKKQVLKDIENTKKETPEWIFLDETLSIKEEKEFFDINIQVIPASMNG